MGFNAHGDMELVVGEGYLISRTFGGFNKEGVDELFNAIFALAKSAGLQDWALIEVIHADAFVTPDAKEALLTKYSDAKKVGCSRVLGVCGNWMQEEVYRQMSSIIPLPVTLCNSEVEAISLARP